MATKELLTRIQLKYDTYTAWQTHNTVLMAGEIAVAILTPGMSTAPDEATNAQHPIMFKVGPGKFNDLPWASALAADVYAWAKQTEADFVKNFLEMKASDGSTMQAKLDTVFATDAALTNAIAALKSELTGDSGLAGLAKRVKALEDNRVTEEELAAAVEVEKQRALAAEQALGKRIDAIDFVDENELATALSPYAKSADVVANTTFESFKTTNTQAIAKAQSDAEATAAAALAIEKKRAEDAEKALSDTIALLVDSTSDSDKFNSIKDLANWIEAHGGDAAEMTQAIETNAGNIEKIVNGTTKVAKAAAADVATKASGLDASGEAAVKAVKVDNATNADKLGNAAAADYLKKAEAPGYADILTKTAASSAYQPKGDYATAAQGALADTAVQQITTTANGGLKVTGKNQIDIDDAIVFVFNCGSASTVIG